MISEEKHSRHTDHAPWDFHSGNLALDFANTIDWPGGDNPRELFNSYADLMNWAKFYSVLSDEEAELLTAEAEKNPKAAATVLEKAVALRDSILQVFSDAAHDDQPGAEYVDILKEFWGQAVTTAEVIPLEKGFSLSWEQKKNSLEYLLYPVSQAAADLLFSEDLTKVGQCADDRGCGLLFIDTSKNHSRQWCSMEDCGNRAKAQRYYRRRKSKG